MSIFEYFYNMLREFFLLDSYGTYYESLGSEICISFASLIFSVFTIIVPFVVVYFVIKLMFRSFNRWF